MIEDVVTTGGGLSNAAALVRTAGADMIAVACAIWRGEGLPRIVGEPNLPIFAALTRVDIERSMSPKEAASSGRQIGGRGEIRADEYRRSLAMSRTPELR